MAEGKVAKYELDRILINANNTMDAIRKVADRVSLDGVETPLTDEQIIILMRIATQYNLLAEASLTARWANLVPKSTSNANLDRTIDRRVNGKERTR